MKKQLLIFAVFILFSCSDKEPIDSPKGPKPNHSATNKDKTTITAPLSPENYRQVVKIVNEIQAINKMTFRIKSQYDIVQGKVQKRDIYLDYFMDKNHRIRKAISAYSEGSDNYRRLSYLILEAS